MTVGPALPSAVTPVLAFSPRFLQFEVLLRGRPGRADFVDLRRIIWMDEVQLQATNPLKQSLVQAEPLSASEENVGICVSQQLWISVVVYYRQIWNCDLHSR